MSQKYNEFVSEPMAYKSVTEIPGLGQTYGDRLYKRGYEEARDIFAEYLAMRGNKRQFREFVRKKTGANSRQTRDCYEAMRDWEDNFM